MTLRTPPALAVWLLRHLGSGYHSESLAGDLLEEYQHDRSSLWFWREVFAAICATRSRSIRKTMARFKASAMLRLLAEIAILLGVVSASSAGTLTWAGKTSTALSVAETCSCQGYP
jgi:hypothetical protein